MKVRTVITALSFALALSACGDGKSAGGKSPANCDAFVAKMSKLYQADTGSMKMGDVARELHEDTMKAARKACKIEILNQNAKGVKCIMAAKSLEDTIAGSDCLKMMEIWSKWQS